MSIILEQHLDNLLRLTEDEIKNYEETPQLFCNTFIKALHKQACAEVECYQKIKQVLFSEDTTDK